MEPLRPKPISSVILAGFPPNRVNLAFYQEANQLFYSPKFRAIILKLQD